MDAATGHIAVEFQTVLTQEETLKAIQKYEDKAKDCGIVVKEYQFNNGGAFTSYKLRERLKSKSQKWGDTQHLEVIIKMVGWNEQSKPSWPWREQC